MTDAAAPTIKVLLVEDDTRLAQLTARYLESHGVVVTVTHDGLEGQAEALRRQYDCIVRELLARIRATVRRVRGQSGPQQQTIQVGALVLDPQRMTVTLDGKPIEGRDRELECDPVLLRRAVDNLLDNAAKYSDPSTTVTLSVVPNGSRVAFEIVDHGIGMSENDLDRAFTPFWRADGSRTRKTGGVGLGLALARRIARVHGGDVTLASIPGKGTTARLEVPLAMDHA